MRLILLRVGLAVALGLPLSGCLDAVVHPLNPEPTAYQDSLCEHAQDNGPVVNYGCVAGRALGAPKIHHHRHRRIVRASY